MFDMTYFTPYEAAPSLFHICCRLGGLLGRPGSLGQTRRLPFPGPETDGQGLKQLRLPARLPRKRILPFPALRSWKQLIELLFGLNYHIAVILVGILMVLYVLFGG